MGQVASRGCGLKVLPPSKFSLYRVASTSRCRRASKKAIPASSGNQTFISRVTRPGRSIAFVNG